MLWPGRQTEYSVKNSPWRDGKGNLVKEVADVARAAGLELGLYLSPWDRNSPYWGTPTYNEYFVSTLWDLINPNYGSSQYGEVFQVWFDYGHDMEIVTPEQIAMYDRRRWNNQVREHAPAAIIAPETDAFYPGNEQGDGPESN